MEFFETDDKIYNERLAAKGFAPEKIEWLKSAGYELFLRPFTMRCVVSGSDSLYSDEYLLKMPLDELMRLHAEKTKDPGLRETAGFVYKVFEQQ